jgi:adenosylmethionine-8-amino-7-oxononanoate aminotransferase
METILGSAGVVIPPQEYFDSVQRICQKHDVLLVLDEVATGFGRTGTWFAYEQFGLRPDLLLLSKGMNGGYLPLGAVLFSEEIGQTVLRHGVGIGHGSSGNGNPACCASALAAMRVMERDGLVGRAARMGASFFDRLKTLERHSIVREVRGRGLMLAIEFNLDGDAYGAPFPSEAFDAIYEGMVEAGVLPYPFSNGLSFFPPLTISSDEIDAIVSTLDSVLEAVLARYANARGPHPLAPSQSQA